MAVRFFEKLITFFFDVLSINIAFFTAFWLRYKSNLFPEVYNPYLDLASYLQPSIIVSGLWVILFFLTGLYRDWYKESRLDELFVVARTVFIGLFLLFLVTSASQIMDFVNTGDIWVFLTRTKFAILLTYGSCMLFFAAANRMTMHTILAMMFMRGIAVTNVIIIGANESGSRLVKDLSKYPQLGYKVVGFIDDDGRKEGSVFEEYRVWGIYSDIPAVVKKEKVGGLIIAHVSTSPNEIQKILEYCGDIKVDIYMVPSLIDVISGHLKTHQIFGVPLMVLLQDHMPSWEAQIKRLMDIVVSFAILSIGAPFWLALAAIIRMTSSGPAIYKQTRVGRNGKNFTMYKFRSMYSDAEKYSGPQWASEDDPRITPVGRFIRKTRLDEIPQFINVLKGEMSLVGPRPERPFFVEQLKKEIPWYVRRIKMKPGITGWAQVKHKYDSSIEDVKQKVIYDLYYFENMSLNLDLKILLRTFLVVLTGKGAH
ncbi:MAG: sugar transferase [Fibrobacter sp.]|jgi:exopolysaccharide biosynthesis polyprenyl glycosylphosphotransferase|nr:sugar transferase [Fibrobacter sp.]